MGETGDVAAAEPEEVELIAVDAGGQRIYLSVRQDQSAQGSARRAGAEDEEEEIGARRPGRPRLEQLLDGLAGFAQEIAGRLQSTDASRVSVQFGCEVMVEAGQLIAVIGKASSKSTITVGLEWDKPTSEERG
ncbi:CU044_2847 family protein [Streptomyces sp. NPDC057301]|uniref:CU044_2847 family protein n=1 Tax=Streptomyces sp. NPDC057301 TaxID=3346093 RepID=UPI003628EB85